MIKAIQISILGVKDIGIPPTIDQNVCERVICENSDQWSGTIIARITLHDAIVAVDPA